MTKLHVTEEVWPLKESFCISRGAKTEAHIVVATLSDGPHTGRGESVPYQRYGETVDGVLDTLRALSADITQGLTRQTLQEKLPAGAARNALDCAFWDLEAKQKNLPVWRLAGLPAPAPTTTAFTIGLDTPDAMRAAAAREAGRPLLKIKLGAEGDRDRLAAVRDGAPDARLIVDANEGWTTATLEDRLDMCAEARVDLIEQPLPAGQDTYLTGLKSPVPLCADESCHTSADLEDLKTRYQCLNIKLDKTGGLTEALALCRQAEAAGFDIMLGCMVATSLAMAPALLLAPHAAWVDLDGPLLLARDRVPGLTYQGSTVSSAPGELWG